MQPEIRYAKAGDLRVAYTVVGDGPFDLVYVSGTLSNVELAWEDRVTSRFFGRLASFSRLIMFDKFGTGLSDLPPGQPTLELQMDAVRAVMAAAGSDRASLMGYSEGGPMSILFAATFPDRVASLVLCCSTPTFHRREDFPWDVSEGFARLLEIADESWGQGRSLEVFAPSFADNERARATWGRWERMGASPRAVKALLDTVIHIDVRPVLPAVRVPTLVIARSEDVIPVGAARFLAERIPGARYWEQPGEHLAGSGDMDAMLDEIEEFLTGSRRGPEPDRVLATVLFTDIVGSTRRAAELGDRRWNEVLDEHDTLLRREIERFRGWLVKSMGDGILATFDGPARAIRCALAARDAVRPLGIEIYAGLHTGEIEQRKEDVGGIAVSTAARVVAEAAPGEVLVTRTVVDLVAGSGLEFDDRGTHALKGVPGEWRLFAVRG